MFFCLDSRFDLRDKAAHKKMKLDEVFEYLAPKLFVTKKTLKNYKGAYKRYLSPYLGEQPINSINSDNLMRALSGVPPQSAYQALMVCRTIMREAKVRDLIDEIKIDSYKTPRINVKPGKFLTWDQIEKMPPNKYSEQIKFLALHGIRWGEAVVLTQDDIYDGMVHINKSIHGATKSAAGNRIVPYLGHFKKFPKTRKPLAKVLNAQGVNIHSLRKTYAYILKTNNVHVTTAQRLLGHASPLVTLNIYTQVLDDEIKKTGEILCKFST